MTDLTRLLAHDMAARLRSGETSSRELAELDTEDIPPTAQTIELENILRDDVARESMAVEDVLGNAAETDGEFIVVPAILGGGE